MIPTANAPPHNPPRLWRTRINFVTRSADESSMETKDTRAVTVARWLEEVRPCQIVVAIDLRLIADVVTDRAQYDLRLALRESDDLETRGVELLCGGVEGFHLEDLQPRDGVGPLILEDVRARGWNGPGWLVLDPEQEDSLRFRCETIEWKPLEAANALDGL